MYFFAKTTFGRNTFRRNTLLRTISFITAILGLLAVWRRWRRRDSDLEGQVVLITGSSRGLGLLLAREFAREGCRLVLCARDQPELERARAAVAGIRGKGQGPTEVLAAPCDVTDQAQVEYLVGEATEHFGRVDILVNNAGLIDVGPHRTMTQSDFENALNVMFWGLFYPTQAVLPQMRRRQDGRIVNITSIGGKVSVPHLLPYGSAKFAAVGFSQGLRAELAGQGITVTTIVPGLMRTGSYLNAFFKGRQTAEFTWFSLGASLPFISMDAERAARQIVQATRRGEAERVLSLPALWLARFHGLFPGLTTDVLGLVARFVLPKADGGTVDSAGTDKDRGMTIQARLSPLLNRVHQALTTLGRRAAWRFHQHPGPLTVLANGVKREASDLYVVDTDRREHG